MDLIGSGGGIIRLAAHDPQSDARPAPAMVWLCQTERAVWGHRRSYRTARAPTFR